MPALLIDDINEWINRQMNFIIFNLDNESQRLNGNYIWSDHIPWVWYRLYLSCQARQENRTDM